MPTIAQKRRTKAPASENSHAALKDEMGVLLAAGLAGAFLGLSAPGIDQWYIAWFGLVPLFALIAASASFKQAFARGLCFGTAYNLMALNWYLGLQPLDWLGFNAWQSWMLAAAAWLFVSFLQGLIIAIFAAVIKVIPVTQGFLFKKSKGQWQLPALIVVPLLWVLWVNKLGNAHCLLGVPWAMLEYSQYRMLSLLQSASIVGGIGIGFLIVQMNVALASLIATFTRKKQLKPLTAVSGGHALYNVLFAAMIITVLMTLGFAQSSSIHMRSDATAYALQGNINIDMQKTVRRYTLRDLMDRQAHQLNQIATGANSKLIVFTESALPTYLRQENEAIGFLTNAAKAHNADMVVGAMDCDEANRPYNSAYGVTAHGDFLSQAYHKRYLVPFGEYTPFLVQYLPEWIRRLTNTPAGGGFSSGTSPRVLHLEGGTVAPLVCFETISPELVGQSVRNGGELLVNISDLAWFHNSICGRQMLAFSVLRAIENRRYFIFAANTGPSAIIDPRGKIVDLSRQGVETVLKGRVGYSSDRTPFNSWFLF